MFIQPLASKMRVNRDAGDKGVVIDRIRQQLGRGAHHTRHVAGRIDNRIPAPPTQHIQTPIAITVQLLDRRKQLRIMLAAIEQCDLMAVRECCFDQVAAEEDRAAEDE